jgi:hypothetical protein
MGGNEELFHPVRLKLKRPAGHEPAWSFQI